MTGQLAGARPEHMPTFADMPTMLSAHPEIDAVAICTPPQIRHAIAHAAISAGKHVFLEKPPATTLGEAQALQFLAQSRGVTLLASWHSRFAPAVERARGWIAQRALKSMHIVWKENVRQWHPGQRWIFEAGGMGVFDPGINALSILTRLLPGTVLVRKADLHVPMNCAAPIQVELEMVSEHGVPIRAEFDFLQQDLQTWDIFAESVQGERMALLQGGTVLKVDDAVVLQQTAAEYPALYAHFVTLVRSAQSDADFSPLRLVADAFMIGRRIEAPAYIE